MSFASVTYVLRSLEGRGRKIGSGQNAVCPNQCNVAEWNLQSGTYVIEEIQRAETKKTYLLTVPGLSWKSIFQDLGASRLKLYVLKFVNDAKKRFLKPTYTALRNTN